MAKKFNRQSWLIHQLRRLSLKYPPRLQALNKTKAIHFITSKKGTQVKRVTWTCEKCNKSKLTSKERELDHIKPVVPPNIGFTNLGDFVDGLFCEESNFQTLCLECHREKSSLEQQIRNKK